MVHTGLKAGVGEFGLPKAEGGTVLEKFKLLSEAVHKRGDDVFLGEDLVMGEEDGQLRAVPVGVVLRPKTINIKT